MRFLRGLLVAMFGAAAACAQVPQPSTAAAPRPESAPLPAASAPDATKSAASAVKVSAHTPPPAAATAPPPEPVPRLAAAPQPASDAAAFAVEVTTRWTDGEVDVEPAFEVRARDSEFRFPSGWGRVRSVLRAGTEHSYCTSYYWPSVRVLVDHAEPGAGTCCVAFQVSTSTTLDAHAGIRTSVALPPLLPGFPRAPGHEVVVATGVQRVPFGVPTDLALVTDKNGGVTIAVCVRPAPAPDRPGNSSMRPDDPDDALLAILRASADCRESRTIRADEARVSDTRRQFLCGTVADREMFLRTAASAPVADAARYLELRTLAVAGAGISRHVEESYVADFESGDGDARPIVDDAISGFTVTLAEPNRADLDWTACDGFLSRDVKLPGGRVLRADKPIVQTGSTVTRPHTWIAVGRRMEGDVVLVRVSVEPARGASSTKPDKP